MEQYHFTENTEIESDILNWVEEEIAKGKENENSLLCYLRESSLKRQRMEHNRKLRIRQKLQCDGQCIPMDEKKQEAMQRLQQLTQMFKLKPDILDSFAEGKMHMPRFDVMDFDVLDDVDGMLDVPFDENVYRQIVEEFETLSKRLVYHCTEPRETPHGFTIALLYVGNDREKWIWERPDEHGHICAWLHNITNPDLSDFGMICVSASQGRMIQKY